MELCFISDTHCLHENVEIPSCDILIHSGDATNHKNPIYNEKEWFDFVEWFSNIPVKHKIFVPGNHDTYIAKHQEEFQEDFHLLVNDSIEINGLRIYGSPYTPTFGEGWAYNLNRNHMKYVWQEIPEDTDVLITHGPPKDILDSVIEDNWTLNVGCENLKEAIRNIKPVIHCFGHIHDEQYCKNHGFLKNFYTTFINASLVNLRANKIINSPIVYKI